MSQDNELKSIMGVNVQKVRSNLTELFGPNPSSVIVLELAKEYASKFANEKQLNLFIEALVSDQETQQGIKDAIKDWLDAPKVLFEVYIDHIGARNILSGLEMEGKLSELKFDFRQTEKPTLTPQKHFEFFCKNPVFLTNEKKEALHNLSIFMNGYRFAAYTNSLVKQYRP